MCSRRMLLSQSRAVTAFRVVFLAALFGTMVGGCSWAVDRDAAAGGKWILVYKVDEKKSACRPDKMDLLISAIAKRLNPESRKGISVRCLGTNMVEITMPKVTGSTAKETQANAERIRKIICATGTLEFRIVATRRDNESLIERAKAERKKSPVNCDPSRQNTLLIRDSKTGKELAKWCRVRDEEVDKMKGDEAAMLVGTIKVKDEQGKDVEKDCGKS